MSSAQGHVGRVLIKVYVQYSVCDLAAPTVGTGHILSGGFKVGCFKGLHEARFFLETVMMHPGPKRRAKMIAKHALKSIVRFR